MVSRNSSTGSPFNVCTFLKNCSASTTPSCGAAWPAPSNAEGPAFNTLPSRHTPQSVARPANIRDDDFMPRVPLLSAPGSDRTSGTRNVVVADDLSVGQRDRTDAADRRAALDRFERNRHLIARLEQQPAPPSLHQVGGVGGFDDPVDALAVGVLHVELQPAMRVGPDPFGDNALELERLADIERGVSVMGKHRGRQQACEQRPPEKSLHAVSLLINPKAQNPNPKMRRTTT